MSLDRQDLEQAVVETYAAAGDAVVSNESLYRGVCQQLSLSLDDLGATTDTDRRGRPYAGGTRNTRWVQQSLKRLGYLENVGRGQWRLTAEGKDKLVRPDPGMGLVAFSTELGIGLWGDCRDVLAGREDDITLYLSSPPYPQAKGKSYSKIQEAEYTDWICSVLEPVIQRLRVGGSIVLVVGNDVFVPGTPARSLYRERLTIALHDKYGLFKMDELIWSNPSKAPGPVRWASMTRQQLNVGYEAALWFCREPKQCLADNRRVLEPHTERHKRLMAQGGEQRDAVFGDGAYGIRSGRSFANVTEGRIPRNVLTFGHSCASQREYKARAREMGLPVHGCPFPLSLARFLTRFLSAEGDLVVDGNAGSYTVPLAAELEGRRWEGAELYGQYVLGGAQRFREMRDFRQFRPLADMIPTQRAA